MAKLIDVVVTDAKTLGPIGGALVIWWDQAGRSDARATDGNGYANFGELNSGGITYSVEAPKHEPAFGYVTTDNGHLTVRLEPSVTPFDVRESGYLTADHIDPRSGTVSYFRREDGSRWPFVGFTMHLALSILSRGNETMLHWYLDWMDANGFNTGIVIGAHLSQWKLDNGFYYDPRHADHPRHLARLCDIFAEHQKRLAYASLADCQDTSVDAQRAIWQRDCEILRDRWNAFPRKGNEHRVNGWHPDPLPWHDVGRCLRSNGSTGGPPWPNFAGSSFIEWEPPRDADDVPRAMMDGGGGTRVMQQGFEHHNPDESYPNGVPHPIVVIEPAYFHESSQDWWGDHRWTSVQHAHDIGANAGCNSAGGGFGCSAGLELRELGPNAAACGQAFAKGLWGAFGQ